MPRCRGGSCSTSTTPRIRPRPSAAVAVQRPPRRAAAFCRSTSTNGHGKPVAVILRPGKTPTGKEVAPSAPSRPGDPPPLARGRDPIRGDGHYGRPEAWTWLRGERRRLRLRPRRQPRSLLGKVEARRRGCRRRAGVEDKDGKVRRFAETRIGPGPGARERSVVARVEAIGQGLDIRYMVTNIATGTPRWLYDELYCAAWPGREPDQAHKAQLASDRTSCRAATANQLRLVLSTPPPTGSSCTVCEAGPQGARSGAMAEFATIRLRAAQDRGPRHREGDPCQARAAACTGRRPASARAAKLASPEPPGPRCPAPSRPPTSQLPITPRRPPTKRSHDQDQAAPRAGHGE